MKKTDSPKQKNKPRRVDDESDSDETKWMDEVRRHHENKSALSFKSETKTFRKEDKIKHITTEFGRVIASEVRQWIVQPNGSTKGEIVCLAGGTVHSLHEDSSLIAVGDEVGFIRDTNHPRKGMIVSVGKRHTKLSRRSVGKNTSEQVLVSNAEQLLIVMAAAEPFYNRRLIDRYIIAAEKGDLTPIICINKIELMPEKMLRDDMAIYKTLGIKTIFVSAETGKGIPTLERTLRGKITVFSGPSGVGKSTIANLLLGEEMQETGEVSQRTWKGRHITTSAIMYPLVKGGFIADTPGLREFGLWDVNKEEAQFFFHEFDPYFPLCKYKWCSHTHEPGCAVIEALNKGEIDSERYQSYVNILESKER
ncbi:MAG: ribosome small subunit-dependent GTPase A [Ignavibacteriae bacterium]|nr:ribosome small subunit-dependent GTPase A [Ignavibacteriota bacterium]